MVSLGMFASRAARIADRRRALWSGSPLPFRAATVTSRISLVKSAPLLAPIASFLRLILVHLLWPDIVKLPLPTPGQRSSMPPLSNLAAGEGRRPRRARRHLPGVPPTGPPDHV